MSTNAIISSNIIINSNSLMDNPKTNGVIGQQQYQ
jgi:hypothetical protein